jgi:hypothetical protein
LPTTTAEVNAALDQHPIETDRDRFLKRTLAMELVELDELQAAFRAKALKDRDAAAAAILIKVHERRSTLLGLNAPPSYAVQIVQEPAVPLSTTAEVEAILNRVMGKPLPAPSGNG